MLSLFSFTLWKDFLNILLEVHRLRSPGFQLLLHELQQRCAQNFEKKCKLNCFTLFSVMTRCSSLNKGCFVIQFAANILKLEMLMFRYTLMF